MAGFKSIYLNTLDKKFFNNAMKTGVLTKEEEKELAENWAFRGDKKSMHKIIRAYSKLVIAYAMKYKNYGLSITDLVQEGHIGSVMSEEEAHAFDDQTGEELDPVLVSQARAEEIAEVNKHKVYEKRPLQECWDVTGKAPVKTRWIDINKGDKVHAEYRSRIVAKDFKDSNRMDLFAATPPI